MLSCRVDEQVECLLVGHAMAGVGCPDPVTLLGESPGAALSRRFVISPGYPLRLSTDC
jgi:hypothetical protein